MLFGAHVKASGGIDKAAERGVALGADAIQVFTQSPRVWRPTNHKPDAIARFREICEAGGIRAKVAHALYLINLGSTNDEIFEKSVTALCNTVDACEAIGLDGVIFHVGSHGGHGLDSCLERVVAAIRLALDRTTSTWVLMENSAGAGGAIGRHIDELARIQAEIGDHPRLGIAIDTCHWFVSGIDIREQSVLDEQFGAIDEAFGLDRLRVLHVNDAKTPFGSNRDRHANMGEGEIGEALGTILAHPAVQGIPAILEVPGEGDGPTAEEIRKLRDLHARASAKVPS